MMHFKRDRLQTHTHALVVVLVSRWEDIQAFVTLCDGNMERDKMNLMKWGCSRTKVLIQVVLQKLSDRRVHQSNKKKIVSHSNVHLTHVGI